MPVEDNYPVTFYKKWAILNNAFKWLRNCIGIAGTITGTIFFASPALSEDQATPKAGFFESLFDKGRDAAPPACSGLDLTKNFSPSENRKFLNHAKKIKNGNARFWKIEKKGVKPSYLYGTMHVTDPDVVNLSQPVRHALDNADRVILELDEIIGENGKFVAKKLASSPDFMTIKTGESFKDKLPPDEFQRFNQTLEAHGLNYSLVANSKPWLIWMMLSIPACETRRQSYGYKALDVEIGENAKKLGKPVIGLETVDEQLAALDDLPISFYARSIEDYFNKPDFYENIFYTEIQLYKNNRIGEILVLSSMFELDISAKDQKIFKDVLMRKRNLHMAQRALPFVKQGNSFIAVGAAHLVDDSGLVEQLRKHGYRVTAMGL